MPHGYVSPTIRAFFHWTRSSRMYRAMCRLQMRLILTFYFISMALQGLLVSFHAALDI
jgi:hypothetical protein